jgi:hypothetical protein
MNARRSVRGLFRPNLIVLLGLFGLAAIFVLVFLSGVSPQRAGEEFMVALAKKDVRKLVEMSYLPNPSAPLESQWEDCVNGKARNFMFMWVWEEGTSRPTNDEAVLRLHLIEFRGATQDATDTYELPLIKRDGRWKVDLRGLTRKFFPDLPK